MGLLLFTSNRRSFFGPCHFGESWNLPRLRYVVRNWYFYLCYYHIMCDIHIPTLTLST